MLRYSVNVCISVICNFLKLKMKPFLLLGVSLLMLPANFYVVKYSKAIIRLETTSGAFLSFTDCVWVHVIKVG